jgi:hypothetical protein
MHVIYGIAILAGGILISWLGIKTLRQSRASLRWPKVVGVITCSGNMCRRAAMYADVKAQYTVDGKTYTTDQISFGQYGTGGGGHAQKEVDRYPKDKEVLVYYDLANPALAVLEPGGGSAVFLTCFMLFFGLPMVPIGLLMFLGGLVELIF